MRAVVGPVEQQHRPAEAARTSKPVAARCRARGSAPGVCERASTCSSTQQARTQRHNVKSKRDTAVPAALWAAAAAAAAAAECCSPATYFTYLMASRKRPSLRRTAAHMNMTPGRPCHPGQSMMMRCRSSKQPWCAPNDMYTRAVSNHISGFSLFSRNCKAVEYADCTSARSRLSSVFCHSVKRARANFRHTLAWSRDLEVNASSTRQRACNSSISRTLSPPAFPVLSVLFLLPPPRLRVLLPPPLFRLRVLLPRDRAELGGCMDPRGVDDEFIAARQFDITAAAADHRP